MTSHAPTDAHPADRLDRTTAELLEQWQLGVAGSPLAGAPGTDADRVLPVCTHDGRDAVLVLRADLAAAASEVTALKAWREGGGVELQRALPSKGALLLEPLVIAEPSGDEAADVQRVVILWPQLHRPASPALPRLDDRLHPLLVRLGESPRGLPVPPRLAQQAADAGRRLLATAQAPVALHGDLHIGHVGTGRAGDAAFAPVGLAGDWGYEALAPLAASRATGEALQDLFWTIVDTTGLDETRLRDWVVTAAMCHAIEPDADQARVSRLVTVAKTISAVQLGDPW